MASDDRSESLSLGHINLAAEEYNFFQLTRLLEGQSSRSSKGLRVAFAGNNTHATRPNFVEGIKINEGAGQTSVKVLTNGVHLFGQQGPLPQGFSELLARQTQAGNPGAAAFVDVFNNKILRALYEIKKRFNPMLFNGSTDDSGLFRVFESVSGVVEGSAFETAMPEKFARFWREYAYLIGNRRVSYGLLKQLMSQLITARIDIEPATGSWRDLPPQSQARLNQTTSLDASRSLGRRYWSHVNGITIVMTFASLDEYEAMLPGGDMHAHTVALIAVLTDLTLDVTLKLRLLASAKPNVQLGRGLRLSQSSWLIAEEANSDTGASCTLDRNRLLGAMQGAPSW